MSFFSLSPRFAPLSACPHLWEHGVSRQMRDLVDHQLEVSRNERLNLVQSVLQKVMRIFTNR